MTSWTREFKVCRDNDGWYKLFPKGVMPEKQENIWVCESYEEQQMFTESNFKKLFPCILLMLGEGPVSIRVTVELEED